MLLTIFVPTNTSDYVESIIDKFVLWNTTLTELLIVVNGANKEREYNTLKSIVMKSGTDLIRLELLQSDNLTDSLNESIRLINGEYVTFIGNDDSFLYYIENAVKTAKKHSYSAIKYPLNMVYFWPGVEQKDSQLIIIKNYYKKNLTEYNPQIDMPKLVKNVGQSYRELNLVNLYHGIVKKTILEQNFSHMGRYVGGFSPDIYFAYSLSKHVDRVMYLKYPLTIPGIGMKSASQAALNNNHQSSLLNSPIKDHYDLYRWSPMSPQFYSVETVWSSSLLIAHEDLYGTTIQGYNYKLLNLLVYLNNSRYRSTSSLIRQLKNINIMNLFVIFRILTKKIFVRVLTGFPNRIVLNKLEPDSFEMLASKYFLFDK